MDLKIRNISRNEILNYLRYAGGEIPADTEAMIARATEEVMAGARAKYRCVEKAKDAAELRDVLQGRDVEAMLAGCDRVLLLAVTLGREIEMLIRRHAFADLAYAVVLDAVASAAVESLAEDINRELAGKYAPCHLTDRFSPGYGDMPMSVQEPLLRLLNAEKDLGLTTTAGHIMIPRKSISAILGVSPLPQPKRAPGCEGCRLYANCEIRKRGGSCAKSE
ncbi:MAG: vitamin B12 dependent-methionine synthase activation domain-containing protein [Bacillota bacterium]|nr:vitamin B12 dependent-methionine synthase activation domain-containing protein [Bacillota bacterium]